MANRVAPAGRDGGLGIDVLDVMPDGLGRDAERGRYRFVEWPRAIRRNTSTSRSVRPAGRATLAGRATWPDAVSTASTSKRAKRPASTSSSSRDAASASVSAGRCGRSSVIADRRRQQPAVGRHERADHRLHPVVARAVGALVVAGGDIGERGQELTAMQDPLTQVGM